MSVWTAKSGPLAPARAHRAGQPQPAHQPLHPATTHLDAVAPQLPPHLPRPVHRIVLLVDFIDHSHEFLITDRARRRRPGQRGIIRGRSDLEAGLGQHGTDRLDSEPVLVFRDERYECGSRGSSSLAKKADAAFRISFARRSSLISRRSRFNSADSSLVDPGRAPASTSA